MPQLSAPFEQSLAAIEGDTVPQNQTQDGASSDAVSREYRRSGGTGSGNSTSGSNAGEAISFVAPAQNNDSPKLVPAVPESKKIHTSYNVRNIDIILSY